VDALRSESPAARTTDLSIKPSDVATWILQGRVKTLNIAGNRKSTAELYGAKVEPFLDAVFRRLRESDGSTPLLRPTDDQAPGVEGSDRKRTA
jgi:hypothetical protein